MSQTFYTCIVYTNASNPSSEDAIGDFITSVTVTEVNGVIQIREDDASQTVNKLKEQFSSNLTYGEMLAHYCPCYSKHPISSERYLVGNRPYTCIAMQGSNYLLVKFGDAEIKGTQYYNKPVYFVPQSMWRELNSIVWNVSFTEDGFGQPTIPEMPVPIIYDTNARLERDPVPLNVDYEIALNPFVPSMYEKDLTATRDSCKREMELLDSKNNDIMEGVRKLCKEYSGRGVKANIMLAIEKGGYLSVPSPTRVEFSGDFRKNSIAELREKQLLALTRATSIATETLDPANKLELYSFGGDNVNLVSSDINGINGTVEALKAYEYKRYITKSECSFYSNCMYHRLFDVQKLVHHINVRENKGFKATLTGKQKDIPLVIVFASHDSYFFDSECYTKYMEYIKEYLQENIFFAIITTRLGHKDWYRAGNGAVIPTYKSDYKRISQLADDLSLDNFVHFDVEDLCIVNDEHPDGRLIELMSTVLERYEQYYSSLGSGGLFHRGPSIDTNAREIEENNAKWIRASIKSSYDESSYYYNNLSLHDNDDSDVFLSELYGVNHSDYMTDTTVECADEEVQSELPTIPLTSEELFPIPKMDMGDENPDLDVVTMHKMVYCNEEEYLKRRNLDMSSIINSGLGVSLSDLHDAELSGYGDYGQYGSYNTTTNNEGYKPFCDENAESSFFADSIEKAKEQRETAEYWKNRTEGMNITAPGFMGGERINPNPVNGPTVSIGELWFEDAMREEQQKQEMRAKGIPLDSPKNPYTLSILNSANNNPKLTMSYYYPPIVNEETQRNALMKKMMMDI